MASAISNNGDGSTSQPVHRFHNTCGKNIRLSVDRITARQVNYFLDGIAFSERTVCPNEKVYLRVTSAGQLRFIRIGFTSHNPASFSGELPITFPRDSLAFWEKMLPHKYLDVGVLLAFHYTTSGDVMLNVNGQDKGVFFKDVDVRKPLWVVFDIYGNNTAVQFVDPTENLDNNSLPNSLARSTTSLQPSASSGGVSTMTNDQNNHPQQMSRQVEAFNLNSQQPLNFHPHTRGVNIRLESDCRTAIRHDVELNNTCVFSSRPINLGESWTVQIVQTEGPFQSVRFRLDSGLIQNQLTWGLMGDSGQSVRRFRRFASPSVQTESIYADGMGFGFTSCNPASLSSTDLPDDANDLLDRPEYWVIFRDSLFAANQLIPGDEIEFHLSHNGEVTIKIKNSDAIPHVMHVDVSLPLWAIFDVNQAIRLIDTTCPPQPAELPAIDHKDPTPTKQSVGRTRSSSECTVCFDLNVDCVLIPCGHECLCYDCALKLFPDGQTDDKQRLCPICRKSVREVFRVYRV